MYFLIAITDAVNTQIPAKTGLLRRLIAAIEVVSQRSVFLRVDALVLKGPLGAVSDTPLTLPKKAEVELSVLAESSN